MNQTSLSRLDVLTFENNMKIKLSKLNVHPENDRIYDQGDLADLEKSLLRHGQMEPLAVTSNNRIISGHRRYSAM